jgi:hypothetical protein
MKFPHKGHQIQLQGLLLEGSVCTPIAPKKLKGLIRRQGQLQTVQVINIPKGGESATRNIVLPFNDAPATIKKVLSKFSQLF